MGKMNKISLVEQEIDKLNKWEKYYNSFFAGDTFLTKSKFDIEFPEFFRLGITLNFKIIKMYKKYKSLYKKLDDLNDTLSEKIKEYNNSLYAKRISDFKTISPTVEDRKLDIQQLRAIVRDDRNQLVIAGAGSGKTTTIVGKIKYLLNLKNVKPEEILLLSFTNVAADDMKIRISRETGYDFDVFTFHKLGYDIIKKSSKLNYQVFDGSFYGIIKDKFLEMLEQEEYLNNFLYFLERGRFKIRDEFSFTNEEEYEEYLMVHAPTTLKNEVVKSYGELEIANFLFKNGINYKYEADYVKLTTEDGRKQYKPDFYLIDYDIYIEYYGIDKNNKVPSYFKGRDGKDASTTYLEGIKWKKNLHEENKTTLIETFYYEKKRGKLLSNLKKNLEKYNVEFKERSVKDIWDEVKEYQKDFLYVITKSFETVTNLIKSNDYTIDEVKGMCGDDDKNNNLSILALVEPLYNYYNEYLVKKEKIDFNDMINSARKHVEDGRYIHNYKYVIVDEYQDISRARYRLLMALREQKDYKLFCVGDDWQSIYRFNGSDISYITNFKEYWGKTHVSKIEHTYRYSNMMADISGKFIMKNKRQLVKNIVGRDDTKFPLGIVMASNKQYLLKELAMRVGELPKDSTVLFLARYESDLDIILNDDIYFMTRNDYVNNVLRIYSYKNPSLRILGMTVHKSKGLEADYVFILNNKNTIKGFPSKISDLPIINFLLEKKDEYPFAEERRLFYVAMTRSQKKTFLVVSGRQKSIFVNELEREYHKELKGEFYECPRCGGTLVKKRSLNGTFWGCTNYKKDGTGCSYTRDNFKK